MTYQNYTIGDDIVQIALGKPEGLADAVARPTNVYLLLGDACALINTGHSSQVQSLLAAIREAGITPAQIERVLYTSWDVEALGGASYFPQADHFVLSPDMIQPSGLEKIVARKRGDFLKLARQIERHLGNHGKVDDADAAALEESSEVDADDAYAAAEAFAAWYYPPAAEVFRCIPLRDGQFVRAGNYEFEVMATPGPTAGSMALYEEKHAFLFSGNFALVGMPEEISEVQGYLISLERMMKRKVEQIFPTYGLPQGRGNWALGGALRFMNNFLTSAPQALVKTPTVLEFIELDLGYRPDDLVELVFSYRKYRALFEELVRTHQIAAEGEGMERRYGTDVDDPRASIRR